MLVRPYATTRFIVGADFSLLSSKRAGRLLRRSFRNVQQNCSPNFSNCNEDLCCIGRHPKIPMKNIIISVTKYSFIYILCAAACSLIAIKDARPTSTSHAHVDLLHSLSISIALMCSFIPLYVSRCWIRAKERTCALKNAAATVVGAYANAPFIYSMDDGGRYSDRYYAPRHYLHISISQKIVLYWVKC